MTETGKARSTVGSGPCRLFEADLTKLRKLVEEA